MPTDDYIKREDVKTAVFAWYVNAMRNGKKLYLDEVIAKIPAADVAEVRHGRWEVGDYAEPDHHGVCVAHYPGGGLYCTECLHGWKRERVEGFEYCPNCGAKMDKEDLKNG